MKTTNSKTVYIIRHSLVLKFPLGAIALLDAVYLPLDLPLDTEFCTNTFGMPRVGNRAFADYADAHVTNLARITNKKDPIPTLSYPFTGFHHSSGEKHIVTAGTAFGDWYACKGQGNTNQNCSTGAVPNIFGGNESEGVAIHRWPTSELLNTRSHGGPLEPSL
ncbi:uncharacterized protein EI90DRAFT_3012953 [Cantharellus anzutake]|uniref:uncharacterized protein n=1 Tax=Cantharellus anzutake TaxID=1750568 RepID=UPI001904ED90|nr:uncharacterized protein EI90DRAFT_3012953 [Cantharellus anzutake]KAF8338783.1 hypothetical protein EI90DRAFT_3012953 [Cantharellus anzutake]